METNENEEGGQERPVVNGNVTNGLTNGHAAGHGQEEQAVKRRVKLTYDEYKKIANSVVAHMRREEDKLTDEESGIKKTDIVNWYLKQIEDQIDSEAELEERTFLINKILDRLINNDGILLALRGEETSDDGEKTGATLADPFLVVHPNYVVEE